LSADHRLADHWFVRPRLLTTALLPEPLPHEGRSPRPVRGVRPAVAEQDGPNRVSLVGRQQPLFVLGMGARLGAGQKPRGPSPPEPLLKEIDDPFLRAVSQLAMAWTSPIAGDFEGALQAALVSLKQLRGQHEPFWAAVAVATVGAMETAVGRYDDALRHLTEARDLAQRFDSAWLTAWSRVQLGLLAVMRGRFDDAGVLLDEGLGLSLSAHSTPLVTLCSFARLALAEGYAGRATLLAGAAEGLRQRAGVRACPMVRRGEAQLVAQAREALGTECFDEMFDGGGRLNQREAVAIVRDRPGGSTRVSLPSDSTAPAS